MCFGASEPLEARLAALVVVTLSADLEGCGRGPESSFTVEPLVLRFAGRRRTQLSDMSRVCIVFEQSWIERVWCNLSSFEYNLLLYIVCLLFALFLVISNHNSFRVLFDTIASVYIFYLKKYLYFSTGNGQPKELAMYQLYRHTFIPYGMEQASRILRTVAGLSK